MKTLPPPAYTQLLFALVAGTWLAGCGNEEPTDAGSQPPTASPEAVCAHLRAADEFRDFGAMLEVMAPESRGPFLLGAWFGAAYLAIGADAEIVAGYEAINSKHGLDAEWLSQTSGESVGIEGLAKIAEEAFAGVEMAVLLDDLTEFTTAEGERFFGPSIEDGPIEVEGDRAVATVGGSKLVLRWLEDGAWYWFPIESEQD